MHLSTRLSAGGVLLALGLFAACASKGPAGTAGLSGMITPDTPAQEISADSETGFTLPVIRQQLEPAELLRGLPPEDIALIQAEAKHLFLKHWPVVAERTRFVHMRIREVIERMQAPKEIEVLPIVESGYNPYAFSHAGATGLWQLMPGTARLLGISDKHGFNGRRDVVVSTEAAIRYLMQMHQRFGNWPLAFAAYHRGPGNVGKHLRHHPWQPQDGLRRLPVPADTRAYVRHILGLAVLTRLGALDFPPAHRTQAMEIQGPVDLMMLARASGLSPDEIFRFNPQLDYGQYLSETLTLDVPEEIYPLLRQRLGEAMPRQVPIRIRKGDSLWKLARKHGTTVPYLRHINPGIRTHLAIGQTLLVPLHGQLRASATLNPLLSQDRRIRYRVRSGDTLWDIAQKFGTSTRSIARANSLRNISYLRPGDTLWIRARIRPS